jgi:hypothetical protein
MFGSAVLELAVGIVFVFLLVSLICSQIGSQVSDILRWRAVNLENGIRNLLFYGNDDMVQQLYAHPIIQSLSLPERGIQSLVQKLPSVADRTGPLPVNIPPQTFALAVFNTFVPNSAGKTTVGELFDAVNQMPDSALKKTLLSLVSAKNDQIDSARQNVENWFNGAMGRVTEAYQRDMWRFSLLVGIIVSIVLNVDAVAVASNLWRDPTLRAAVAQAAAEYEKSPSTQPQALDELNRLELPIGWHIGPSKVLPSAPFTPKDWESPSANFNIFPSVFLKILGWLITGLAGAQGAPFWFDLLKKLTQRG